MARVKHREVSSVVMAALAVVLMATSAAAGLGGAPGGNGQKLFEFGLLGSGPVTVNCNPQYGVCSASLTAQVSGNVIGKQATFSEAMTWDSTSDINSNTQGCSIAAGSGSIVTKRGDQIDFTFNGLLCEPSPGGCPSNLNATYIVSGGTGRFATSVGSGNFTQNNLFISGNAPADSNAGSPAVGNGLTAIVRFDGLLTKGRAVPTSTPTSTSTPLPAGSGSIN
ncbi:MAG: hypothetical protein IVW54_11670 [Candidatus Binataceae bacterium]|nr:hypothetical protein [Candidatus Binataceae bacterium]